MRATYSVVVSGTCGDAVTNSASLTVNQNVVVTSAPVSVTNCPGTSASFSVSATGTGLSYQWYKGTSALPDQTGSSLVLANVSADDAGTYNVVVCGTCGSAIERGVDRQRHHCGDPLASSRKPWHRRHLRTAASGTGPPTYAWKKNGANIAGANRQPDVDQPGLCGRRVYTVEVGGTCSTTEQIATLTINIPPTVSIVSPDQWDCLHRARELHRAGERAGRGWDGYQRRVLRWDNQHPGRNCQFRPTSSF